VAQTVTIGRVGDIPDGSCVVVEINGKEIAVFHSGGNYYAIDDRCPHAGASLSGGCVEGDVVTCGWHYWRFRLTDGAWLNNPKIRTGAYPVRVVGDEIQLELPDPA
jgi:nitrite reductase (NADH) small subunit/3-phenylpropionate/trans-cinnamate dioxygenase ferredoxin subunit